ncbi:HD domain-containing protein [Mycoplasma suis]|uniref:HD domain-containing protein n=1 Tax=Mycoplasma suis TaxID=57372 RepID=UPI0002ED55C8|nr:HD domain-containing protein [Mycoplasma suis]
MHENFPGATHSRLSHSLGVYALTSKFISHFLSLGDLNLKDDQLEIDLALASALLHDLGHGPFSHFFEWLFPNFSHEEMTKRIILNKNSKLNLLLVERSRVHGKEDSFFAEEIVNILSRKSDRKWIEELISSDIDVDRLDYLLRDRYFCGSFTLSIDPSLIIKWTRLLKLNGQRKLAFLQKTNYQRYSLLLAREYMQREVYSNPSACSYQVILFAIFQEWKKIFNSEFVNNANYELLLPLFEKTLEEIKVEEFINLKDYTILSKLDELFWEIKKSNPSSTSNSLYSLLLLFRGNSEESNHVLVRMQQEEFEKFNKFSLECPDIIKEEEILQTKRISSLISHKAVQKIQKLSYFDLSSKTFKDLELSFPFQEEREIHFVLMTKKHHNNWLNLKN